MALINEVSKEHLRTIVERIESLEDEKTKVTDLIKEIYSESKGQGYDVKALRQIIRMRKMRKEDLAHQEELLDLYRQALGI